MEREIMIAELTENCNRHRDTLIELLKSYDLAVLGREMADAHEKDIHNRVLAENEFYVSRRFERDCEVKFGDRITDETYDFLMSKEDFERYLKLSRPIMVAEGVCDENGYYLTDWVSIKVNTMNVLVDFIIANILPTALRETFAMVRRNVVQEEKLIDITRKAFAA